MNWLAENWRWVLSLLGASVTGGLLIWVLVLRHREEERRIRAELEFAKAQLKIKSLQEDINRRAEELKSNRAQAAALDKRLEQLQRNALHLARPDLSVDDMSTVQIANELNNVLRQRPPRK